MKTLFIFLITTVIFFSLDMLWLGLIAKSYYQEKIGFLMANKVKWVAAGIFYVMYIGGIMYFAIMPSIKDGDWQTALLKGAILGMLCYATYDLTNMATLKGWPLEIVIVDIIWGAFLTGTTATLSYILTQKLL